MREKLPAAIGPNGFPRSWRDYVYALHYLAREHVRQQLAIAEAVRFGQAALDDYNAWHDQMKAFTDVPVQVQKPERT